jgi:hypothetical protein
MQIATFTAPKVGRSPRTLPGIERRTRRVLLACGVASSLLYVIANDLIAAAHWPGYSAPTPWLGVIERTMLGAFLLWMVVLAVALWPTRPDAPEG